MYSETLTEDDIEGDGRLYHQDVFFEVGGPVVRRHIVDVDDRYYYKLVKGSTYYILPKKYRDKLPLKVKEKTIIKLKLIDTQVCMFIQEISSMKIPKKKSMTFKEYINNFNPVEHSNPTTWKFLRILAHSEGVKVGICGEVGLGKNINLTLRRYMARNVMPKIKDVTRAKLYRSMYFNNWINIDEINSWQGKYVEDVEALLTDFGDDSPEMDKYARDSNRHLEKMTLLGKSLTFSFNRPDEIKTPQKKMFERRWANPSMMIDRYPLLLLNGKVTETIKKLSLGQVNKVVEDNFKDMCQIVSNETYWREEYHHHLNDWDRGKCSLERRHLTNISPLLDRLDVYSETQAEFDLWMMFLNKAYKDYNNMVSPYLDEFVSIK
jgi:hypothetical protein